VKIPKLQKSFVWGKKSTIFGEIGTFKLTILEKIGI
jgi:hypothetical protein